MGEIKSTLDIIMEKTRDLTLSEEEKRAFHEEEIQKKVKGLMHRYLSDQITGEQLQEELRDLGKKDRDAAVGMLRRECGERLDPWGDNGSVLTLLRQAAGMDTEPVEKLLTEWRREMELRREDRIAALREEYADQGISGSAVVPNPDADPQWRQHLSEKRSDILRRAGELLG